MSLRYDIVPATGKPPTSGATHLLVLHGLGDSRTGWRQALPAILPPGVTAILAEAPLPYPPEEAFGWSWFDIHQGKHADLDHVDAHRALLLELIRTLGVEPSRLAVLGFSQGGLMALDLALRGPYLFAAVVVVSGWLADPDAYPQAFGPAARAQRILATHGEQDETIPLWFAEPGITGLTEDGINLEWRVYDKGHHLDADEAIEIREFLEGM